MKFYSMFAVAIIISSILQSDDPTRVLHRHSQEMRFSAERPVQRPVVLPVDVITALRRDEYVRDELDAEGLRPEKMPLRWFSASEINLSDPDWTGLVVKGEGPLLGANVTPYWIFNTVKDQHGLLLTTFAHDLIIDRERWRGYPKITTMSATAEEVTTICYRFEGSKYQEFRRTVEPIK